MFVVRWKNRSKSDKVELRGEDWGANDGMGRNGDERSEALDNTRSLEKLGKGSKTSGWKGRWGRGGGDSLTNGSDWSVTSSPSPLSLPRPPFSVVHSCCGIFTCISHLYYLSYLNIPPLHLCSYFCQLLNCCLLAQTD